MEAILLVVPLGLLAVLAILAIKTGWGIVVTGFVVGALLGGVVGLLIGVASAPGAEAGGMYELGQAANGMVGGAIGLLIGAVLGSTGAWLTARRSGR